MVNKMTDEEKMKILEDILLEKIPAPSPEAAFIVSRHKKKRAELQSVVSRIDELQKNLESLKSDGIRIHGALRECVEQLSEVILEAPKEAIECEALSEEATSASPLS